MKLTTIKDKKIIDFDINQRERGTDKEKKEIEKQRE